MPSLNRAQIMGHMTRDSEMRYTPGGKAVTNFSLATNWGSGDNKTVEYHNCVIWDANERAPRAQWAAKLKKGDLVFAEGRIVTRIWEGQDGVKHRQTEIVCDKADLLRAAGESTQKSPQDFDLTKVTDVDPDDIPF